MKKGQRKGRNRIVPFASAEGIRRFQQLRWKAGHCRLFEAFQPQETPVWCAIASAAAVLNTFSPPENKLYQRTFFTTATDRVKLRRKVSALGHPHSGLTLGELQRMVKKRAPKARVERKTPDGQSLRRLVKTYQKTGRTKIIANFATYNIWGGRGGHFSPLGGYHASSDSVLVLDVAIHRTPWYWCPVERLARACSEVDPESGEPRGCLLISA